MDGRRRDVISSTPDDGREMAVAVAASVRLRTCEDGKKWLSIRRTVLRMDRMFSGPVGTARFKLYGRFAARSVCRARTIPLRD